MKGKSGCGVKNSYCNESIVANNETIIKAVIETRSYWINKKL